MEPIIRVAGISKRYRLGGPARPANNLREALGDLIVAPLRRLRALGSQPSDAESFWALRDVSFEVQQGAVLGVIGRNGAGKSTLLKILSRITEPTEGRIELRGRVASLLEVGTGFHPELTGRENIFLNGTILGMRRHEITKRFDEIVAFAEVARFVDTPVKRYSSGMYVRLAFAVAAHLEPEILIIDEVLAVGDAEFQRKCLGKMSDVASKGRTVLFVSHNMAAVRAICATGLLLRDGRIAHAGPVDELIAQYTRQTATSVSSELTFPVRGSRPQFVEIGLEHAQVEFGGTVSVSATLLAGVSTSVGIEIEIHDERGAPIAYLSTAPMMGDLIALDPDEETTVRLELGPLALATGHYHHYFWLIKPWTENYDVPSTPLAFEVIHSDPGNVGFEFRQSYARGAFTVPLNVVRVPAEAAASDR